MHSQQFEIRGWDIERFDPDYVFDMIRRASGAGMNTVSLSHEIVMNAEEIIWDWHRYQHLRRFCDACHDQGMSVYLWNHQIVNPPEEYIAPPEAGGPWRLKLDEPGLWVWLAARYERVVQRVPNFDGIILSLTESQFQVHRDNVAITRMPQHERMARVINAVREGLGPSGKRLIVRDFLRSPAEMDSFVKALELVPTDVWVFSKCVPNDWQYCYPPHPLLGKVGPRKQVMEFDLATETGGNSGLPFPVPEYYQRMLRIARERGLVGAIGRCDDGFRTNRGQPDEMNIFAFSRLLQDPDADCDMLWSEWCTSRFGAEGAYLAETVLRRSFDMVTKTKYTLGFWTGHSAPSIAYTDSHLLQNSTALWSDEPVYREIDALLKDSGPEAIEAVVREKRDAQALAERSLRDLEQGQSHLSPADCEMLRGYYVRGRNAAIVGRLWARAYFAFRWWRNTGSHLARAETMAALAECGVFVEEVRSQPDADPLRLPAFAAELTEKMEVTT